MTHMRKVMFALWASAVLLTPASAVADDNCKLTQLASLPLKADAHGVYFTTIQMNGQDVNLALNLTKEISVVSREAIEKLHLDTIANQYPSGSSVGIISRTVVPKQVQIGSVSYSKFEIDASPTGPWPFPGLDGWISTDLLSAYDMEWDFAGGKLNLYSKNHCPGHVIYWTHEPAARIPMRWENGTMVVGVQLNDQTFGATLDPASPTIIDRDAAKNLLGVGESDPQLQNAGLFDGQPAYRFPFASIALDGGIAVQHPDILLVKSSGYGKQQYVLGGDVLRKLRLFFAFKEGFIYATGAGAH